MYARVSSITNSADEAIEIFASTRVHLPHVDRAIKLKHEWDTRDKEYWFRAWRDAVAAMPFRTYNNWTIQWVQKSEG